MAASSKGIDWAALAAPFEESQVKVRVQTVFAKRDPQTKKYPAGSIGMAIHYIDARNVMERLDAVVGPDGWSDEYTVIANGPVVECKLTIRVGDALITKTDVGYPNGDKSPEPAKDAYSDALKRAAVKWGIGRFLYDMDALKVKVDVNGNIDKILGPMDAKTTMEDITSPGGHQQKQADADSMAGLQPEFEKFYTAWLTSEHKAEIKEELGGASTKVAAFEAYAEKSDEQRGVLMALAIGAMVPA